MNDDVAWYVAQLKPNGLKKALDHLHRQHFSTFAPDLTSSTLKAGIRVEARRPLFPGYLFVSFDPHGLGWTAINATRGVARLITNDPRRPTPLPSALIAGLMARCDASGLLLPPERLEHGDRIRVLSGPFADTITTIETLPDRQRIGVLLDVMGRKVLTTLPCDQIQKIG